MITYISILRGINVSGQKMIKMTALKELYEAMKFSNVRTYIQSGNVIFQFAETQNTGLEKKISDQIAAHFGFEVPATVLRTEELKGIIERNPFAGDKTKETSFLHVTFLSSKPEFFDSDAINKVKATGEELALIERAVYLYCPFGYGKTKLSNTFLENKFKVKATTRNWNTTLELLNIASSGNYTG
jgi:uncharacterized protein (DUF1697 family)